ncbi:MAG: peptidoglycan-binding protein, partial [bacterium]|nr:peptidoglycan-binding protein [bacterium]
MATKKFRIIGRIINRETQQGVAGLRVEAWDKDTFFNDLVGRAVTAESGDFHIEFSEAHYKESF